MKFRKKPPKKSGFYWIKWVELEKGDCFSIAKVIMNDEKRKLWFFRIGSHYPMYLEDSMFLWGDKIEEPK